MKERFFSIHFDSHRDLMKYLNNKLKPNEKLVQVYFPNSLSRITAIFERVDEKPNVHDYVVVNYNQKENNTITSTPPFYCGGCTTMVNDLL